MRDQITIPEKNVERFLDLSADLHRRNLQREIHEELSSEFHGQKIQNYYLPMVQLLL